MIPKLLLPLFAVIVITLHHVPTGTLAQHYEPNWESLDSRPLPAWYDKAKIGIFLHWGVYSVPAFDNEWFIQHYNRKTPSTVQLVEKIYGPNFKYESFAPMFHAEFYNPNEWAELFVKSGAKYVVLTSKHHEGFTLWPSKFSPGWNAGEVGPKRDLVGDLAQAVRGHNLTFGLYHSLLEWYHPLYQKDHANNWTTHEFVTTKVRPCLEELVNAYKPDVIFSDGDWEQDDTYWNSTDFLAWLYNESPVKSTIVVNDRWGRNIRCKHGGYLNCNDRFSPNELQPRKFENCMKLDHSSWGYRRTASLSSIFTMHDLLFQLIKTVAVGGNILINVGPRADGKIDIIFEERLLELGAWLQVNGEAIYESKVWQHQVDSITKDLWYTERAGHVYGLALGYRAKLDFGHIPFDSVKSIHLLGHDAATIPYEKSSDATHHTVVHMPVLSPLSQAKHAYVFRFLLN